VSVFIWIIISEMALAQNMQVKNKTKTEQINILNTTSGVVCVLNVEEYDVDNTTVKVKLSL
jgi:PHD/YefM family antitoxin component YafN of YafNO toxin-antitoxin module